LLSLRHVLLAPIISHFIVLLAHAVVVPHLVLLGSQYLLVLLLSDGLPIFSDELLLSHLVLLLVDLLIVGLLLVWSHLA
jgi:hypothetical protein